MVLFGKILTQDLHFTHTAHKMFNIHVVVKPHVRARACHCVDLCAPRVCVCCASPCACAVTASLRACVRVSVYEWCVVCCASLCACVRA